MLCKVFCVGVHDFLKYAIIIDMAIRLQNQKVETRSVFGATIPASRKDLEIPERLRIDSKESLISDLTKAVAEAEAGKLYDTGKAFKIINNAIS